MPRRYGEGEWPRRTGERLAPRPSVLAVGLVVNMVVPAATYIALRSRLHSDVAAVAVGAAAPAAWSIALAARRRRVDPVALSALAGIAVAVGICLASGGSALPLLLRHAMVTGTLGSACLVSILVGRPLLVLARPPLVRSARPGLLSTSGTGRLPADVHMRYFTVLTAIVGTVLLAHAVMNVVLALTVPTTRYLVVSRPAGWAITATGAAAAVWYVRRARPPARGGEGT
jgi:hypothetical protein